MEKLLYKLKDWVKVIQAALIGTIIFEAILVIIIGISSNNIDKGDIWLVILISCIIVYVFLLIITTAYQLKFPGSIIEELISKKQLEEKIKLFDRQKAINEYIDTSIKGLNKQTCVINYEGRENLCDQELETRLRDLLSPIITYTDVLLDTSTEKKFTLGVYLDEYKKLPESLNGIEVIDYAKINDKGILILNDELGISRLLPKELLEDEKIDGASYEIQTAIKRTLNNLIFYTHNFTHNSKDYTIMTSEILEICSDDYVNGVLFIIYNQGIKYPTDVADILRIFNRITANYVSKYNSCIEEEINSKKSEQEKKN